MRKRLCAYQFLIVTCLFVTAARSSSAQLIARFSSNITEGCAPLVVRFKDESSGNPVSWKWDLGNGTTSYFQNPSATYFNPGTYTVKLVVSNSSGVDSTIKTRYITVFASPIVDFVASDTGGCYPLRVAFNDRSSPGDGSILKWLWDFGDGSTDSVQHPQHVYTDLGNYNVSLQVRNSNGCVSTLTRPNYIQLKNGIRADFNFSVPNNCKPPTTIPFISATTGTGLLNYEWDFGDGSKSTSINPVHIYNSAGTYTVKLVAHNNTGCIDSLVKHQAITIGSVDADFTYPAVICAGQSLQLINRSQPNPTAAFWKFGDGTTSTSLNPIKKYNAGGNYIITLVSDFGACKDSASKSILVLEKPHANFSATNNTACHPPLVTIFSSGATGAIGFKWYFGDGDSSSLKDPSHIYKSIGDFDVVLVVTNSSGCTDTIRRNGFVTIQPPHATIANIPQEGCEPYTYIPSASIQSVDSIVRYEWDFGDGTILEGKNLVHIYSAGTYSIKLIVTSAGGCTDTVNATNAVRVGTKPLPAFSANPRYTCSFKVIKFADLTSGSVDGWLWRFGDGGISTDRNPTHFYQDTGYFNLTLIVTNNGCKDSIRLDNYIYIKPPIAKFIDSSGCGTRFTKKFIDKSIGATSWYWDFGDGYNSTDQNPTHTFSAPGNYTVQLTVKNDTCESTTTREIVVIAEKADFTASDTVVCKGRLIEFNARDIQPANIAIHQWEFGDGVVLYGGSKVSHSYSSAGQYDVRLIITDINGCSDTLLKPIYIRVDGPTADFSSLLPGACLLQKVVFVDASVPDSLHSISSWTWNYGDGKTETLSSPPFEHAYVAAGNYTVTLTVADTKGCIDSIAKRNTIRISQPKADFFSVDTNSCSKKTIRFTNLSAGPLLTYKWDFGDGQSSPITNPVHVYNLEGRYPVRLKIIDQYGCIDSILKENYISIYNPVAQFSMSDSVSTCPPLVVNFANLSQHFISYEWDFGDGTKSALQNPIHFYTYPGTYHAKLKVTSPGGCIDSLMKTIVVRGPQGNFSYDRNSGCIPTTVNFVASTKDLVSFIWDFNDGETISSPDSIVSHTYTMTGEYLPKMILRDPQGCQVPIVGKDTIRIYGVNANFGTSRQIVCDSGLVYFRDSSISNDLITGYRWTFGDGSVSTSQHSSHWYSNTGEFPIQLIVTTQHHCSDTINNVVPIRIVKTPRTNIIGDTASCVPAILQFNGVLLNSDTSALRWQWNFGNNVFSNLQHPNAVNYITVGTYNVRLILTNSSNCADTAYFPVVIHPLPNINAGPDAIICRFQQKRLEATGGMRFAWTPASSLSCNNCASPMAKPDSTINYVVHGENIFGCTARDSVLVTVKQPFKIKVAKGDTLCKGESYMLEASGAESYRWSPSIGLDDAASARPKARPDTTTLYRVVGSDNQGCFNDTAFVRVVVYPYPLVDAGPDQTIIGGSSVPLNPKLSQDVKQIRWVPEKWLSCYNCPKPMASPKQTTKYSIVVTNEGGCVSRGDISIFVLCEAGNLFMPNTFSPNGDGVNDVFYPRGKGIYSIKNFRVFDRWGGVVFAQANFQANDISKGWNGTVNGKLASQDVYVYTIDVICENNVVFSYKGNVALIR